MASQVLVIHERVATWARQLRPRLADRAVRVAETRSGADLKAAIAGAAFPVVLVDLARRPGAALDDLGRALGGAADPLVLVIDPGAHEGVADLARELGAAHVWSGPAAPPAVAGLIARWLPLARRRAESSGWAGSAPRPPEPEPWNWLSPLLDAWPAAERTPGD